jgi:hypothetical protein
MFSCLSTNGSRCWPVANVIIGVSLMLFIRKLYTLLAFVSTRRHPQLLCKATSHSVLMICNC